jgi:RimJ/RimL family protein N-acetyltransferase
MIILQKFERTDFDELISWVDNEQTLTNWSGSLFSFPLTHEALDWYVEDTNLVDISDAFIYKAADESGKSIGHISLGGISWKNRSSRLSRVLIGEKWARGKGYCQGMVKAALKIGFDDLHLHRIGLGVYENNTSAIHCYEQCGLKIEGIQRDVLLFNGTYLSMVEMAILENDWRSINK